MSKNEDYYLNYLKPGLCTPGVWSSFVAIVTLACSRFPPSHESLYESLLKYGFIAEDGFLARSWFVDGSSNSIYIKKKKNHFCRLSKSNSLIYFGTDKKTARELEKVCRLLDPYAYVYEEGVTRPDPTLLEGDYDGRDNELRGLVRSIYTRTSAELMPEYLKKEAEHYTYGNGHMNNRWQSKDVHEIISTQCDGMAELISAGVMGSVEAYKRLDKIYDNVVDVLRR